MKVLTMAMSSIVIIGLLALMAVISVLHHFERRDLYNRLMSRDLSDYRRVASGDTDEHRETAHQKAIKKWRSG